MKSKFKLGVVESKRFSSLTCFTLVSFWLNACLMAFSACTTEVRLASCRICQVGKDFVLIVAISSECDFVARIRPSLYCRRPLYTRGPSCCPGSGVSIFATEGDLDLGSGVRRPFAPRATRAKGPSSSGDFRFRKRVLECEVVVCVTLPDSAFRSM